MLPQKSVKGCNPCGDSFIVIILTFFSRIAAQQNLAVSPLVHSVEPLVSKGLNENRHLPFTLALPLCTTNVSSIFLYHLQKVTTALCLAIGGKI
jgi:hypothetical protein